MRGTDLLQDMEYIDEQLIEEAAVPKDLSKKTAGKKRKKIKRVIGTFTSVAAVALISIGAYRFVQNNQIEKGMFAPDCAPAQTAENAEKIYEEAAEIDEDSAFFEEETISGEEAFPGKEIVSGEQTDSGKEAISGEEAVLDNKELTLSEKQNSELEDADMAMGITVTPGMSGVAEEYVKNTEKLVMIHGVIYYDSGKISKRTRSEKMDGYIDSVCDGTPEKEGESNFGKGYGYQFWPGCVEVCMKDEWHIFYPYEPEKVFEPNRVGTEQTATE